MFHDVSHAAARRVRIRAGLPVEHPGVLDEINGLLDGLPDPEHLCVVQRAGPVAAAAGPSNRLDAWLSALAGAALASPGVWAALIARDRGCIRCVRPARY